LAGRLIDRRIAPGPERRVHRQRCAAAST